MRRCLFAFACGLMVFGCTTDSFLWQRYTENDFPAQVQSVTTNLGGIVDAKNRVTYGSWTVGFGEGKPYASYNCSLYAICEIIISNLRCDHPAGASVPCELKLKNDATCKLVIPERQEAFPIGCPLFVALEKSKGDKDKSDIALPEKQKAPLPKEGAVVAAKETESRYLPRGLVLGLRAGVAIPTQTVLENLSNDTNVGPLVNVEALYALREWVRVGLMFEWHQHDINLQGPQFGTLNTFSLLPTVEFRPTREAMRDRRIEWFIPYASLGTGINFHSFSNAPPLGNRPVSFSDTFALRLAGGLDFPLTSQLALNTEVAWNRDSGTYKLSGAEADFNASSLNLLIGLRVQF
jgi:hypothetical protein